MPLLSLAGAEGYKHFSKTKPMKLEHFQPAIDWWNNREEIIVDESPKAKKYTVSCMRNEHGKT